LFGAATGLSKGATGLVLQDSGLPFGIPIDSFY
jgi:hypothetical protein